MKTLENLTVKDLKGVKEIVFNFKDSKAPTFNETGFGMFILRNVYGWASDKVELIRTNATEYQWEYWGGKMIEEMKQFAKNCESIELT